MSSPRPQLKLNVRALPIVVALLIALQLSVPYHGWMLLLVGLGGIIVGMTRRLVVREAEVW